MPTIVRHALGLLTPRERARWAGLVPLALLAAAMEASGAAVVFGLIKILGDPTQASHLPIASAIYRALPWHDNKSVVLSFTVLVACFYVSKNLLLAIVAFIQSKVSNQSVAALSKRMLRGYMAMPLAFHFRRNSSELIRNCTDSAEAALRFVLGGSVSIITEALVTVGIIAVLLATAPFVTLIATVVLFGMLAAILKLTRRGVVRLGVRDQVLRKEIIQSLQQSLGALKEVKVLGREEYFLDSFARLQEGMARLRHFYTTLIGTPHLLIETVFVCGMLSVVILITAQQRVIGADIVSLLGLYAYAGFRVIPSTNRILMNLTNVRNGSAAVERLHADRVAFEREAVRDAQERGTLSFLHCLSLRDVSYTYGGAGVPALTDITLEIERGESVGIVGPTGAGKSTLVDVILGLLPPSSGVVTVDGRDICEIVRQWRNAIGYVPQSIFLIDDTLRHNVALGVPDGDIDEERLSAAVRMAQLEEFVATLPRGLEAVVGERGVRLSGGQRQRVGIARALYHEPQVLIFDEATSALDNRTEREVTEAIESLQGKKTLIIIAHRLTTVRICDRLVFLNGGRLAGVGSFDELLEHNTEFRAMASLPAGERRSA